MGDFLLFYKNGGLFMHLISVSTLAAAFHVVRAARISKRVGETRDRARLARAMELGAGFVGLSLAVGVLGTLFGLIDTAAAVQGLEGDDILKATMRGLGISVSPLCFALMLAIPVSLLSLSTRAREARRLGELAG